MPKTAKIGAMPTPSCSQRPGREERKSGLNEGRMGITIEDLKQQTAVRLAKQQESRQRKNTSKGHHANTSNAIGGTGRSHVNLQPQIQNHGPVYQNYQFPQSQTHTTPNNAYSNVHAQNKPIHHEVVRSLESVRSMQSFEESEPSSASVVSDTSANILNMSLSPTAIAYNQNSSSHHSAGKSKGQSKVKHEDQLTKGSKTSYGRRSHGNSKQKKSPHVTKLPHGLTVQELKEMTRARLASEATDGSTTGGDGVASPTSPSRDELNTAESNSAFQYNRQRVYSHETAPVRNEIRQRLDSDSSLRSAPPSYRRLPPNHHQRQTLHSDHLSSPINGRNMSNARLSQNQFPGISTYYSADAADTYSVNSYTSGITDPCLGSDASDRFTAASSRELGKSSTFPLSGSGSGETEADYFGSYLTASASYDTSGRRLAGSTLSSPGLSNLLEDKPYSPEAALDVNNDINVAPIRGFASRELHASASMENDTFSDILQQPRSTPSSLMGNPTLTQSVPLPSLAPNRVERQVSRSADLPNSVAESVLGSLETEAKPDVFFDDKSSMGIPCNASSASMGDNARPQNPWNEGNSDPVSNLETEWNNLFKLDQGNLPKSNSKFGLSSFHSKAADNFLQEDWKPVEGIPLTPSDKSNAAVNNDDGRSDQYNSLRENFEDDGMCFSVSSPMKEQSGGDSDLLEAKTANKKTQRMKFW